MPLPALEGDDVLGPLGQAEDPGRAGHLEGVARGQTVEHEVRDHASGRPLDRDRQLGVDRRRGRHGVAAQVGLAVHLHPEGAELAGLVGEGGPQLVGHVEDEGAGLRGLADDAGDGQGVEPVVVHRARPTGNWLRNRHNSYTIMEFSSMGNEAGRSGGPVS